MNKETKTSPKTIKLIKSELRKTKKLPIITIRYLYRLLDYITDNNVLRKNQMSYTTKTIELVNITRQDLYRIVGFSKSTGTEIINDLINAGILIDNNNEIVFETDKLMKII